MTVPRFLLNGRISKMVVVDQSSQPTGELNFWFYCPGCEQAHRYAVNAPKGPSWNWDGNVDAPTFTPSLLMRWNDGPQNIPKVCHLFITTGRIHFCGDCTHALAGQTVEVPELPDWLR